MKGTNARMNARRNPENRKPDNRMACFMHPESQARRFAPLGARKFRAFAPPERLIGPLLFKVQGSRFRAPKVGVLELKLRGEG